MIICRHWGSAAIIAIAMLAQTGCDSGTPSRTADEFAADSALAADLALANRDTLLVDSIGAYREPSAAEQDTSPAAQVPPVAADSALMRNAAAPAQPKPVVTAPVAPAPATAAPAISNTTPKPPAPRLTGTRACRSPTTENQSECMRVLIATADARLNRIYRALITEMRRQEGVSSTAKDPPSVQRLRVAQRAWLVYRDTECRRRGRGKEGALWARPRARCLGEFSVRRANELADNFSRLTAH
jgi:uncharacterized protein YecT (DUF1311 family)